jgi:hypothetical protein
MALVERISLSCRGVGGVVKGKPLHRSLKGHESFGWRVSGLRHGAQGQNERRGISMGDDR